MPGRGSGSSEQGTRYRWRRRSATAANCLIFGIMAFGQFMALLDIQIVAASLNSIQAGLSAGPDEIAWVQTAYLMAEIVMIPLAAFLSPGAVDALAVHAVGGAVHPLQPRCAAWPGTSSR